MSNDIQDPVAPKPKLGRPPKANIKAESDKLAAAPPPMPTPRPRVSIIERRTLMPFGEPSTEVHFKDSSLEGRWFNAALRPQQIYRAVELGWQKVTPAMVSDLSQLGMWTKSPDGYVTRGERGLEILMCMAKTDREMIQAAKTKENNKRMGQPNAQLREAAEALGKTDSEGAEFLADHAREGRGGPVGGVMDYRERIERTEAGE